MSSIVFGGAIAAGASVGGFRETFFQAEIAAARATEAHAVYSSYFEQYVALYLAMKPAMQLLHALA